MWLEHLLVMITLKFLENWEAPDLKLQFKIHMVAFQNPEREALVQGEINHQPQMLWDSLLKN